MKTFNTFSLLFLFYLFWIIITGSLERTALYKNHLDSRLLQKWQLTRLLFCAESYYWLFGKKKKNYHFLFEISFLLLIKKVNPFYLYCWHDLFWVWFWICHLLAWLCLGLHVGTCITSLIIYFLVIPAPSFSVILLFVAKKHQKNVLFTAYFVF